MLKNTIVVETNAHGRYYETNEPIDRGEVKQYKKNFASKVSCKEILLSVDDNKRDCIKRFH